MEKIIEKLNTRTFFSLFFISIFAFCFFFLPDRKSVSEYKYPEFYKGVYSGMNKWTRPDVFKERVSLYRSMGLNTIVFDSTANGTITREQVEYCKSMNMHIIARVCVFPGGLKVYPAPDKYYCTAVYATREAIEAGFKEIQLDYIRFTDSGYLHRKNLYMLSDKEKLEYIVSFVVSIKSHFRGADIKWQADIFGRIPVRNIDRIGQNMEEFDKLFDAICPMVYPSYYSHRERKSGAYRIVSRISRMSQKRTKNAKTILWLQGFKHKNIRHLSYSRFILQQIEAAYDSGADGFIFWNAVNKYNQMYAAIKMRNVYAGL